MQREVLAGLQEDAERHGSAACCLPERQCILGLVQATLASDTAKQWRTLAPPAAASNGGAR